MEKTHVLVADDDQAILRFLHANLKARGYEVTTATDGKEALDTVEREPVNLIILDIMMPKMDGIEVCRRVREWSKIPIIMLSARGDENGKVKCLELGADDYLTKPFGVAELIARIKTALRHSGNTDTTPVQSSFICDNIEVNYASRRVTISGKEIKLTPTEYLLLQQLVANSDKVLTHGMLLKKVWGDDYSTEKEYLRVFIGRLRRKIEPDPNNPKYIMTIPGVGYHFITAPNGNGN